MTECLHDTTVRHRQVSFETLDGDIAFVDEDILEVLKELRRHGVRTHYSCQGGLEPAYVVADWRSFHRLLRKIRRRSKTTWYGPAYQKLIQKFLDGYHEWEAVYYRRQGLGAERRYGTHKSRGDRADTDFSIEHDFTNLYGCRLCIRWPAEETDAVYWLLVQTP